MDFPTKTGASFSKGFVILTIQTRRYLKCKPYSLALYGPDVHSFIAGDVWLKQQVEQRLFALTNWKELSGLVMEEKVFLNCYH